MEGQTADAVTSDGVTMVFGVPSALRPLVIPPDSSWTWMRTGKGEWVFGTPVRGVIRNIIN